jgi:hypothetical protein
VNSTGNNVKHVLWLCEDDSEQGVETVIGGGGNMQACLFRHSTELDGLEHSEGTEACCRL